MDIKLTWSQEHKGLALNAKKIDYSKENIVVDNKGTKVQL
jgi:hypothetical protein